MDIEQDVTVEEITRLVKFDEESSRPRAMRVSVLSETQRWKVIGRGKSLATMGSPHNKIFIQPDMNKEERQKEKQLIEELREKRDKDSSKNWYIRRGRVIERRKKAAEETAGPERMV